MASAYPQRLASIDRNNWTFEAIYTAQGDLHEANNSLGASILDLNDIAKNPNASTPELVEALRQIENNITFHFGSKAQADEVVEHLKGPLFADARGLHPLMFNQGDTRSVNVAPTITGTPLTPGEINDYRVAMQNLEQSIIPFARQLQSQAKALKKEIENKIAERRQADDTIPQKNLKKAQAEKVETVTGVDENGFPFTETRVVPAGNTAKDAVDSNANNSTVQNPSLGTGTEDAQQSGNVNAQNNTLLTTTTGTDVSTLASTNNRNQSPDAATDSDIAVGSASRNINGVEYPDAFFDNFEANPNKLKQYASYTYRIGLYLQSKEEYINMVTSRKKSVTGLSKILESGGTGGPTEEANAIFPDLFIDDLDITTLMMQNTGNAHNAVDINFSIIEPMGFTFLKKLKDLCSSYSPPMIGFSKQHYLLVISFTGYDENGAVMTPDNANDMTKFIPFKFSRITTTVKTGSTTYICQAVPPGYTVGQSVKRAAIRFNVELAGRTLNDIFNATGGDTKRSVSTNNSGSSYDNSQREFTGDPNSSSYTANRQTVNNNSYTNTKANVSAPQLSTQGIIEALNKEQKKYVEKKKQQIADEFEIRFMGGIGQHKVVKQEALQLKKDDTPMNSRTTQAKEATQTTGIDTSIQKYTTVAGLSLNQFIDLMMRSSDYITKQQNYLYDEKEQKLKPKTSKDKYFLQWYNITSEVIPLAFDEIRQDYAYRIIYTVAPKKIIDTYSSYFNKAQFTGVHKKYDYWFTGKNSEIIDFEQDLNAAFYVAMDNRIPEQPRNSDPEGTDEKDYAVQNSDGTGQYGLAADRAAGILYSPVDFAKSIMTIFGDPDYIQQAEIFYEPGQYSAFLDDGSVNYESREVLYSVDFKTQTDYDDRTGNAILQSPQLKDADETNATGTGALIYSLIRANTRFSQGVMTQELEGLIREFADKQGKVNASTDAGKEVDKGETGTVRTPKLKYSGPSSSYTSDPIDVTDRRYPGNSTRKHQPFSVAVNKVSPMGNDETSNYNVSNMGNPNRSNYTQSNMGNDDDTTLNATSSYNRTDKNNSISPLGNQKQDTEVVNPKPKVIDTIFPEGGA